MKQIIALLFCGYASVALHAQTTTTDPPMKPLKERIIHTWKYSGWEQFYVFTPADSVKEKNDQFVFTDDGKYTQVSKGVSSGGTWTINEDYRQLYCTDAATGVQKMYTIKKLNATTLILNFQTPDLVNTKYTYLAK